MGILTVVRIWVIIRLSMVKINLRKGTRKEQSSIAYFWSEIQHKRK